MFGVTGLKLGGIIAGIVAIVGALTWLVATVRDRDRLAGLDAQHTLCTRALAGDPKAGPIAGACELPIALLAAQRDADAACEAALASTDIAAAYQVRTSCPANVKTLQANVVTLTANNADLAAQLADARADAAAAVTRGEARATVITTRSHDAQAAISAAPLGGDGLIRCAGACLRALAGDAARPARP